MEHVVVWIVVGVAAYFLAKRLDRKRARDGRLAELNTRYDDPAVARALANEEIWVGMSEEQLRDSLGPPKQATGTNGRATFQYAPVGKKRPGYRVTLDDGRVTGWEPR